MVEDKNPVGLTQEQEAQAAVFKKQLDEMTATMLADAKAKADAIVQEAEGRAVKAAAKPDTLTKEQKKQREYMEEKVKLNLFKDAKDYKDDVFVAVNGLGFLIQRGVEVEVPRYVAQVIEQGRAQDLQTDTMILQKAEEFRQESDRRGL